jgi:hypothetical protein
MGRNSTARPSPLPSPSIRAENETRGGPPQGRLMRHTGTRRPRRRRPRRRARQAAAAAPQEARRADGGGRAARTPTHPQAQARGAGRHSHARTPPARGRRGGGGGAAARWPAPPALPGRASSRHGPPLGRAGPGSAWALGGPVRPRPLGGGRASGHFTSPQRRDPAEAPAPPPAPSRGPAQALRSPGQLRAPPPTHTPGPSLLRPVMQWRVGPFRPGRKQGACDERGGIRAVGLAWVEIVARSRWSCGSPRRPGATVGGTLETSFSAIFLIYLGISGIAVKSVGEASVDGEPGVCSSAFCPMRF